MTFNEYMKHAHPHALPRDQPLWGALERAWDAAICAAMDTVVERDGVGVASDAIARLLTRTV